MSAQYTRSQLRDVLVEFYSRVDPARLDAGIDINGMIDWIIYHGPDDMNARLMAKYGQGLNFDILKQPKSTNQSAMHRISMMPNTQLIEQQQKRLELRAKVEAFYKENDPDKLGTVDTFVEWIEVNGEKAFNDLLLKKYGKTMGIATRPKPTPPTPPPAMAQQQAPPQPAASGPKPGPPTLPPRQNSAPSGPDPDLIAKLNRFYALHEPDQPNDPLPIAEWAQQVGMTVLNEKLMQLYGGSLDTLDEDEAKAMDAPPPPPPEDDGDMPPPPPQDEEPEPQPEPEPETEESEWEPEQPKMPEPPKPPTPPMITMPEPPKPPQLPVLEPPKPRFTEPPKKPEPPKLAAPKPAGGPPKAPEPPRFVPKPTPLPSLPVLKMQGGASKPMPPHAPSIAKPQNIQAALSAQAIKPPAPGQRQRKRRPSEGACDQYMLDLSGDGFGVCVCGFNRAAHNQPKITGTERRSIKVKAPMGKQERPCTNYRVDVSGKTFGDCVCGWSKMDHNKIDWHPPVETKAPMPVPMPPSMPMSPKAPNYDPNAIVEMVFDQATTTVYNMMVESYVEQHGEEPDEETRVDWASNLAILSVGKDPSHGTKLKIRAKAIPKKKN